jgi:Holliday junction DNA helicase RuvA
MIAYLTGFVSRKLMNASAVVVEVGGVGYLVGVSSQTLSELPLHNHKPGDTAPETITIEIYHHRTEADERLFGFITAEEKQVFEKLITVKGVGPKVALGVLSGLSWQQVIEAVEAQDARRLAQAPGIGKKTAERLVLELSGSFEGIGSAAGSGTSGRTGSAPGSSGLREAMNEAASALEALGYSRAAADKALQNVAREQKDKKPDVQAFIKAGLRALSS